MCYFGRTWGGAKADAAGCGDGLRGRAGGARGASGKRGGNERRSRHARETGEQRGPPREARRRAGGRSHAQLPRASGRALVVR